MTHFKKILLIFIIICTGIVFGQEPWNIEFVSRGLYGKSKTFYFQDDYMFIGAGARFMIYDNSDWQNPVEIGFCYLDDRIFEIYVVNSYAYIITEFSHLVILDISNSNSPIIKSEYQFEITPEDLIINNNKAYIFNYNGVEIIDVENPETPYFLSGISNNSIKDILISDNYLYTISTESDFDIIDISNPENPILTGNYSNDSVSYYCLDIHENKAYITSYLNITILDITNKSEPTYISSKNSILSQGKIKYFDHKLLCNSGFQFSLYDLHDMVNPQLLYSVAFKEDQSIEHMDVYEDKIYVLNEETGLNIYNISEELESPIIGNIEIQNSFYDLAFKDSLVFVLSCGYLLSIVDISDYSSPELLGQYTSNTQFQHIVIYNDYAFLSNSYRLEIVNISDLSEPVLEIEDIPFRGGYDTEIVDHYLYSSGYNSDLKVMNISSIDSFTTEYQISIPGQSENIQIIDTLLYLSNDNSGLMIFDISEPSTPILVDSITNFGGIDIHFIHNNTAYISDNDTGFHVINLEDRTSSSIYDQCFDRLTSIVVYDNTIFLSNDVNKLFTMNISDIYSANLNYKIHSWAYSKHSFIHDEILYINGYRNFLLVDPNNVVNPEIEKNIVFSNKSTILSTYEDYIFLNSSNLDLTVAEFTDINNPEIINSYSISEDFQYAIVDSYAIVIENNFGIRVLDISDPYEICEISNLPLTHYITFIETSSDYAVCYSEFSGLSLIDISDPYEPVFIGRLWLGFFEFGYHVHNINNNQFYVSTWGEDLYIIDMSDPEQSQQLTDFNMYELQECEIYGDYAFTNTYRLGLLDVKYPHHPEKIDLPFECNSVNDIKIHENHLYVLKNYKEILTYEISDPKKPVQDGYINTNSWFYDICVIDDLIIANTQRSGISIYRTSDLIEYVPPEIEKRLYSCPNPFQFETHIELPLNTHKIEIYDIYGRLCHSADITGYYLTYTWQPLDNTPNGVYYIKAFSDSNSFSGKVVYIK